jgi:electron transport complex protein RnfD
MAKDIKKNTDERMDFLVSSSPHMHSGESIPRIMWLVVASLAPAIVMAVIYFGLHAVNVLVVTTVSCMVFEALFQWLRKSEIRVTDGSAVVTGVLLALNLPPSSPWWLCIVGAFIAIGIAKEIYGGLGYNPFNPALVARVALLISFPTEMTSWTPTLWMKAEAADAITTATPLGAVKEHILKDGTTGLEFTWNYFWDLMTGNIMGSLGETSVIALLIGGLFLLWRGYINWRVPVSFIGSVFVFTGVAFLFNPVGVASPIFHVVSGGLIIGAFFMATDMVTSPVTKKGMWIFGIGCGVLTAIIRLWGGYPEGVSFAILIMNATVPLLDRYFRPKVFGEQRKIYEVTQ